MRGNSTRKALDLEEYTRVDQRTERVQQTAQSAHKFPSDSTVRWWRSLARACFRYICTLVRNTALNFLQTPR